MKKNFTTLKHCPGFKIIASLLLFFGLTVNSQAQILAESFEGQIFPAPGWTVGPDWGLGMWQSYYGSASHAYKSVHVEETPDGYNVDSYLVTPAVMLQAGQQVEISFDYIVEVADDEPITFKVYVGPDNDVWEWDEQLADFNITGLTPYTTHTINFTAIETGNHYFGFYVSSVLLNDIGLSIDKIIIQDKNDCQFPDDLEISSVTDDSASLNWDSTGVTEWQVQITQGMLPSEGYWDDVDSVPVMLTNLVPGTEYTAYVRSVCADEQYSIVADPSVFTTTCPDVIEAPYTMTFAKENLPNCWTLSGDTNWNFNLYADYEASKAGDHTLLQGITQYAWVDGSENTDGKTARLISPSVDISGLAAPALEFFVYSSSESGVNNSLVVELFDGTNWQTVASLDESSDGWKFYSIDLNNEQALAQARFTVTGNGMETFLNDILIDDISFREKTLCLPAEMFVADNITDSSATLSWESNGDMWDIYYGKYDEVFNGTANITSVEAPYTLTGLEASTLYLIYIRPDCENSSGEWSGPFMVNTSCDVYIPYYEQNFNASTFYPYSFTNPGYPECWGEASGGDLLAGPLEFGTGEWKPNPSAEFTPGLNSQSISINLTGLSTNSWLLSPLFNLSAGEYEAKVKIGITTGNPSPIAMGMDDEVHLLFSENGSNWQSLKVWTGADNLSSGYNTAIIPLDGIEGGSIRFAFWTNEGLPDDISYQFHVDHFEVRQASVCGEPINLSVIGVTHESAKLSWETSEEADSWMVAVVPTGVTPADSDWITVNDINYTKTELTPNTSYDFYVKAMCGNVASEITTGPVSFATRCIPLIAPYTETFVDYQTLPECWLNKPEYINNFFFMTYFWNYSTSATAEAVEAGDHTPEGNTNYAWLNTANNSNQERAYLTTPVVDISPLENPAFQFYLFSKNTIDNAQNHVIVKIFDGENWSELTKIISDTDGWAEHTIDLSSYAGGQAVQVQFEILVNANDGYPGYNQILIDDVSFMEMPECPAPFNLAISNVTENSAVVNWENASGIDLWEIEYGPSGFLPGEGIVLEVESITDALLNNLESGQEYEVYVSAICNDSTKYIGPASFITDTVSGINDRDMMNITCYPNPVADVLNIESPYALDRIEVYNVFGQLVVQQSVSNTSVIVQLNALSSGMYWIKAYSGKNLSAFRIIKN